MCAKVADVLWKMLAAAGVKRCYGIVDAVVDPLALSLPSHVPFHTAKGFTLSFAKQVWAGNMEHVIKTIERNVRLV
jgi:hypothetical protein